MNITKNHPNFRFLISEFLPANGQHAHVRMKKSPNPDNYDRFGRMRRLPAGRWNAVISPRVNTTSYRNHEHYFQGIRSNPIFPSNVVNFSTDNDKHIFSKAAPAGHAGCPHAVDGN